MGVKSKKSSTKASNNGDNKMKKVGTASQSGKTQEQPYILTDKTVTKSIIGNLSQLLAHPTTRQIFFEFSEKEMSSNHLMFYFDAKEFRDKFVFPPTPVKLEVPESQGNTSQNPNSNAQDSFSSAAVKDSNNDNVTTIDSNNTTPSRDAMSPGASPVTQRRHSDEGTDGASQPISSTLDESSTSNGNKVSRESSFGADSAESQEVKNFKQARDIYDRFLSPTSPIEVNLDYRTFSEIHKKIDARQITDKLFDRAIKEIYDVINNDSYHRFRSSPIYKSILQQCTESPSPSPSTSSTELSTTPVITSDSKQPEEQKPKSKKKFACFG